MLYSTGYLREMFWVKANIHTIMAISDVSFVSYMTSQVKKVLSSNWKKSHTCANLIWIYIIYAKNKTSEINLPNLWNNLSI